MSSIQPSTSSQLSTSVAPLVHTASLETTIQTLDHLTQHFTTNTESSMQQQLKQLKRELKEIYTVADRKLIEQQQILKRLIHELTQVEKQIENNPIEEILEQQQQVESDKENVQQQVNKLNSTIQSLST